MTLTIKITGRVPAEWWDIYKVLAEEEARSMNQIINLLLARWAAGEIEARPPTAALRQVHTTLPTNARTRNQTEKGATDDDDSN